MSDIYRYLISKEPTLLTTKGALSVFKHDDNDLNEKVIQILKTNKSPVLFELYRSIMGTVAIHKAFLTATSRRSHVAIKGKSYITGKWMNMKCHYQEWYYFDKLD